MAGYPDGSANAPAGTAQFPTLLNGYTKRPPWRVAGVDYAVGYPSGQSFANPSTISMTGVSVNAGTHTVTISGNNVTLDGYDFSLSNGWGIVIGSGATNVVIQNSNFAIGSNANNPIAADNTVGTLTVTKCVFDEIGGAASLGCSISTHAANFTSTYNWFKNAQDDSVDLVPPSSSTTATVKYNLFYNQGTGNPAIVHPDSVQFTGGTYNGCMLAFNTIYQPVGGGEQTGLEGIQICAQLSSSINNTTVSNNTIVAKSAVSTTMSVGIAIQRTDSGQTNNIGTCFDNYMDPTGFSSTAFYPLSSGTNAGHAPTNWSFANNIDMTTGSVIPAPV